MKTDRNKPIRKGKFYGSPACCNARLCTWAAYQRAKKDAAYMVERLGPNWQPRVWENLGWHAEAKLSGVDSITASVSAHRHFDREPVQYCALVNAPGGGSYSETADDPVKAIKRVVRRMRKDIEAREVLAEWMTGEQEIV